MPHIALDRDIYDFHPPVLEGEALTQVHNFCECLGYQMTRHTLMKHEALYNHGCNYFFVCFFSWVDCSIRGFFHDSSIDLMIFCCLCFRFAIL